MSPNKPPSSCWSRWARTLGRGAAWALTSLARRVGGSTLLGVPVSAAILSRVVAAHPLQPLDEVAQLFVSGRVIHLPVIDHGRVVSVITRGDVAAGLARLGPHGTVAASPSHHVVAVAPSDSLVHVLAQLEALPDSVAVVLDRDRPVGVLTASEVTAYLDGVRRTV